ncbi:hypothetical protein GCM10009635_40670 [Actinocatenispora thailandica]
MLLAAYAVGALVELTAVAQQWTLVDRATKPLLMPLLAAYLLVRVGARWRVLPVVVGLAFACGGDIALLASGMVFFALGMGLFAVTHLCYLVTFARSGALAGLRRRAWVPVLYALGWLTLLLVMRDRVSVPLLVALAAYGVLLYAMASSAACLDVLLGVGGLLFAVSDSMIALGTGGLRLPAHDLAVMVTYLLAQGVLVVRFAGLVTSARVPAGSR